jgi:hypothetical protein
MPRDMQQRQTLGRFDDESRKRKVGMARDIIYKKNYAVDNDAIDELLADQSLVPTLVGLIIKYIIS